MYDGSMNSARWATRRRRLWLAALSVLTALATMCLIQLACRSGGSTARGDAKAKRSPQPTPRTIQVDGHARLDVTPDRVDLRITLTEQAKSPRAAAQGVRQQRKRLFAALRLMGLPAKRIQVSYLHLSPRYARYGASIVGYDGRLTFVAKLTDPEKLADYVEAAAAAGASHLYTRYHHSRMSEMKRRVREMALRAARAKAEQMARVTGVAVGQLLQVSEGAHANWTGRRWGWGSANLVANDHGSAGQRSSGATLPEQIPLHLTVAVKYAIRTGG